MKGNCPWQIDEYRREKGRPREGRQANSLIRQTNSNMLMSAAVYKEIEPEMKLWKSGRRRRLNGNWEGREEGRMSGSVKRVDRLLGCRNVATTYLATAVQSQDLALPSCHIALNCGSILTSLGISCSNIDHLFRCSLPVNTTQISASALLWPILCLSGCQTPSWPKHLLCKSALFLSPLCASSTISVSLPCNPNRSSLSLSLFI